MMNSYKLIFFSVLLFIVGCATHPPASKAEKEKMIASTTTEILSDLVFTGEVRKVYDAASDEFRDSVEYVDFAQRLASFYSTYPQNRIIISGYEFYEKGDLVAVFAESTSPQVELHYRLLLSSAKNQHYGLTKFDVNNKEFPRSDDYLAFTTPVILDK